MPLSNLVPRGFGFVYHSIAILYHEVPNLSITIRTFFIALRGWWVRAVVLKKLDTLEGNERKAVSLMGDAQIVLELYVLFKRADKNKTGKVRHEVRVRSPALGTAVRCQLKTLWGRGTRRAYLLPLARMSFQTELYCAGVVDRLMG